MSEQPKPTPPSNAPAPGSAPITKTMDSIVALCRRRGFIWQSSEIYGGINGFWDYGPLGVELKRNLKNAWWHDVVRAPGKGPNGNLIDMVGVDCTIIMNPKIWVASGHAAGFNDPMVDDRETKARYRADQLFIWFPRQEGSQRFGIAIEGSSIEEAQKSLDKMLDTKRWREIAKKAQAKFGFDPNKGAWWGANRASQVPSDQIKDAFGPKGEAPGEWSVASQTESELPNIIAPQATEFGTLTPPRQFNLMFETFVGAVQNDDSKAWLRPETAQGIFAQFRNVLDTSRVKVPFGIAQQGKAFRNEVTPRNFTFRSREFEQMEIEFFIHPDTANEWYAYWRDTRFNWWKSLGLASENLQLREHGKDELSHYAKAGAGTSDIEYRFPFTAPGFGELEGIAHRTDFDLKQHAQHSGLGDKLKYFDQELQVKLQAQGVPKEQINEKVRYFPHVIEPSAGADRGTLAVLCEAFTPDAGRPSGVVMKFHPRLAPIKAGIYPLVNKDGMPEIAEKLYLELRGKYNVEFDEKQAIGKRYARMDEAGTPFCFTVDSDTLKDQTVTVRHRDTLQQERIGLDKVPAFLAEKIGG